MHWQKKLSAGQKLRRPVMLVVFLATGLMLWAQIIVAPTRPVTAPQAIGISANGGSFTPVVSGNSHRIVFTSYANNLITNDDTATSLDVFVRDLTTEKTFLVSANGSGVGGGNGFSAYPAISSNGQYVAFLSAASDIVAADTNSTPDIYLKDLNTGTVVLVSASPSGNAGAGGSAGGFEMTPDGRFVAFSSTQTNLVTNTVSKVMNVFVRDMQAGTTELISLRTNASGAGSQSDSSFPSISADGNLIAYYGAGLDQVVWGEAGPPASGQVYLRDRLAGTTVCVGTNAQPFFAAGTRSFGAALSSDGSGVAFIAVATNSSQSALIYVNLLTSQASLINTNVDTNSWPQISADGKRVAYVVKPSVFVWDAVASSNILASSDMAGQVNGIAQSPSLSADGTRVAFVSNGTNMTTATSSGQFQLYMRDLAAQTTRLVSPSVAGGSSGDQELCFPTISPDGRMVAFATADDSLVADDRNNAFDAFAWDSNTERVNLISIREIFREPATDIGVPLFGSHVVSADGRRIAFTALDGNWITKDANGWSDVFVRDMEGGETILASGDANGQPTTNGPANSPSISADGRYVAFLQGSPINAQLGNIYLRDTWSGVLTLITTTNGAATGNAAAPTVSANGHFVAYHCSSSLAPNDSNQKFDVYLYDVQAQTNRLISVNPSGLTTDYDSIKPVFSPDARWLVFQSKSPSLVFPALGTTSFQNYARDLVSNVTYHLSYGTNRTPLTFDTTNAVFSADSRYVSFSSIPSTSLNQIYLHDFLTLSNQLICTNCFDQSLSSNANLVAYLHTNKQVYVYSRITGQTNLVTVDITGTTNGNGYPSKARLTSDGRFVVFTTRSTNLTAYDTNLYVDVFVRDLALSNTVAISGRKAVERSGRYPSVNPVIAADDRTVIFQSRGSGLVPNDFNDTSDLFLVRLGTGDSDHDGLDDDWEMTYFNNLSHDGSDDSDGDGATDLQEFWAGTNPTGNTSVLRCLAVLSSGGAAAVYWSAVPGRSYRVEFKSDLQADAWQTLAAPITVNSDLASVIDNDATLSSRRFYRIVALP